MEYNVPDALGLQEGELTVPRDCWFEIVTLTGAGMRLSCVSNRKENATINICLSAVEEDRTELEIRDRVRCVTRPKYSERARLLKLFCREVLFCCRVTF